MDDDLDDDDDFVYEELDIESEDDLDDNYSEDLDTIVRSLQNAKAEEQPAAKEAAEQKFGRLYWAPMGNVRKRRRDGSWKNRIIQDLIDRYQSISFLQCEDERLLGERLILNPRRQHGSKKFQQGGRRCGSALHGSVGF